MDMSLSKLWEIVKDREACCAVVYGTVHSVLQTEEIEVIRCAWIPWVSDGERDLTPEASCSGNLALLIRAECWTGG